ncbi:MAG: hypothetical protein RLO81_16940 [Fulvivirga sp.]|uniref:P-loop ATPase, Sll1717 family n=1 Tax=Fulvivirga sp. TaxID=1931237 RepID=UPI0032EB4869
MGIFEKLMKKTERPRSSTRGFYFGATEAEGENIQGQSLIDYFEDYLDILSDLEKGKFIFVGRKGVGKSAIAKFIKDTSDLTNESYAKLLRVNDFEIEKHIQLEEKNHEKKEKMIFEWLILVNIIKLIVSHECGQYTAEYDKLKKFLDVNAGIVNVDQYQFVEGTKQKGGQVSFGGLKHVFGGIFKNYFDTKVNKAEFYKLIPPLKEIVKVMLDFEVNRDLEFWLLFDDLDINFNVKDDRDNVKIMELLRVAKEYNNEIFRNNTTRILLFIRDDIRDEIAPKYEDSAKIFNTYQTSLNWYDHRLYTEKSEELIPLKKLANRRIKINFDKNEISYGTDPWLTLFQDENYSGSDYPKKSSFKYILDFTFYRPRDIITFLNTMTDESCTYPLNKGAVKSLLKKFVDINITEIKSELKLFFSDTEISKIFNELFPYIIQKQNVKPKDVQDKIEQLSFELNRNKVFDILINYSLIIYMDSSGTLYFNYRDNTTLGNVNKSELYMSLPKCIYHYYKRIN